MNKLCRLPSWFSFNIQSYHGRGRCETEVEVGKPVESGSS